MSRTVKRWLMVLAAVLAAAAGVLVCRTVGRDDRVRGYVSTAEMTELERTAGVQQLPMTELVDRTVKKDGVTLYRVAWEPQTGTVFLWTSELGPDDRAYLTATSEDDWFGRFGTELGVQLLMAEGVAEADLLDGLTVQRGNGGTARFTFTLPSQ